MNYINVKNLPSLPYDVSEAINQLRINLEFCGSDIKSIAISSSVPNEGKSFVSMCLWQAIAGVGKRVLLIDCDLRNSEIRSKYGLSSDTKLPGIVHYLSGKSSLNEVICSTNVDNAFILPLENKIPNPTMLLESPYFDKMIAECSKVFDFIIIDTPPVNTVADALKIVTHTDGSVLVIRSHETPRKIVMSSIQMLQKTGKPVLGTILNRIDTRSRKSAYYSRYYRYGHYYKQYGYGSYGYGKYGDSSSKKK